MNNVEVLKTKDLKLFDEYTINEKNISLNLNETNNTGGKLILLYIYKLPLFEQHGFKVGMTKCKRNENIWSAIKDRIHDQKSELALNESDYEKYGYKREVVYWGVCISPEKDSFKDYYVHDKYKEHGFKERKQEWFFDVPLNKLISIFEECRKKEKKVLYKPREEQRNAIKALKEFFTENPKGKRFLLNCKMRFGKCFTTYKFCEEFNLNKILILTFVPAVEDSWEDDLGHIKKEYEYLTDEDIKKSDFNLKEKTNPYVLFLSLQNFLGKVGETKEAKEKIEKVKKANFDLVILDEYHFGAWNSKTQKEFEEYEGLEKDYQKQLKKENQDIIKKFNLKTEKIICLSGTPFAALERGEFDDKNSFTYSYFDERKNKYPNDDKSYVNKDYEEFPDMEIFGYNMKDLFEKPTFIFEDNRNSKKQNDSFLLNKFFETEEKTATGRKGVFIYEEDVKKWLDIIKTNPAKSSFPYSLINQEISKHSLWLMHSQDACLAMEKLLKEDDFFNQYQIINLSGENVGNSTKAYKYLMSEINRSEEDNKSGSIAITVNKLTIGVTVKKWSSVLVLKDLKSPETYFQSIFRIQTPYKENDEIKKKVCRVYDFCINRAANLELKYCKSNNSGEISTKRDWEPLVKLLVKYLPIFLYGEVEKPLNEKLFMNLALYGDTSKKPLSKRLSDPDIFFDFNNDFFNDILNDEKKIIFFSSYASSKTNIDKNKIDENDSIFIIKEAQKKGSEDAEKFSKKINLEISDPNLYLTDYEIQKKLDKLIEENCEPESIKNWDEKEKNKYKNSYINGIIKNLHLKKQRLKEGVNDGKKFILRVQKEFGPDVKYVNRVKIRSFVNKYLNNKKNIPEKFCRSTISCYLYKDSFRKTVFENLSLSDEKNRNKKTFDEIKRSCQNVILNLFIFIYVSPFREKNLNDVKNSDRKLFLEITKHEIEEFFDNLTNLKEESFNNFTEEFSNNEALGEKNNKRDDDCRNSLNWFGFGLEEN